MNVTFATMPIVVQVRPKGAGPFHWPHHLFIDPSCVRDERVIISFEWATISADVVALSSSLDSFGDPGGNDPGGNDPGVSISGYAAGYHRESAVPWSLVEQVIDAWFDAHDEENWLWEFQLAMEPAHHLRPASPENEQRAREPRGSRTR